MEGRFTQVHGFDCYKDIERLLSVNRRANVMVTFYNLRCKACPEAGTVEG